MSKATVCAREIRDDGAECFLHLVTSEDEQVITVAVPYRIARNARLFSEVDLPPGDPKHPEWAAGIVWRF